MKEKEREGGIERKKEREGRKDREKEGERRGILKLGKSPSSPPLPCPPLHRDPETKKRSSSLR